MKEYEELFADDAAWRERARIFSGRVRDVSEFLAAIGLQKLAKLSSGSAWGVVIGFYVIRAVLAVCSAAIFGG